MDLKYYDEVEFRTVLDRIDPKDFEEPVKSAINNKTVLGRGWVVGVLGDKIAVKVSKACIYCPVEKEIYHECPVCLEDHYGPVEEQKRFDLPVINGEVIVVEKDDIKSPEKEAV